MIEQVECDCGGTEFELYGNTATNELDRIICVQCGIIGERKKPDPSNYDRAMKGIDL